MRHLHSASIWMAAAALLVAACGGGKPAESPGGGTDDDCPPGTSKQGGDCVAPPDESGPGSGGGSTGGGGEASGGDGAGTGGGTAPAEPKTPYDKDNVEMVLKRAAVQVKGNCGAATDANGKAIGPWGQLTIHVDLGRNGHVHAVDVPEPYGDNPVGRCIKLAFKNLVFPPYAAPVDSVVPWDVELVEPASESGGKKKK